MSSIAGVADPAEKAHKKSFHRRNDSGELDVFEAARYFSGYNEAAAPTMMKEDRSSWRGGRISLDMPIRNVLDHQLLHHHHHHAVDQKQNMKEKIKHKQPSSPGGRLASFLNSLFNQSSSKKKKPKSSQSMKDEEESPGGRRRRRSSISHFRSASSTTTTDAKSIYSSSSSGFRTPPPYSAQIATAKSHKDWRISHSDHKPVVSNLSKHDVMSHAKSSVSDEKVSSNRELNWLDEKFKYNNRLSLSEKYKSSTDQDYNKGLLKRLSEVVDVDDDDGAESDSSSDLFELQNYDLGDTTRAVCLCMKLPTWIASRISEEPRLQMPHSNIYF
ncbi:hypothetical protein ACLB2K_042849 [Fragaria x ananassa]